MQNLQQQLGAKTEDYDRLMNLFNALSERSDHEATTLLARIRLGEPVQNLIATIEAAQGLSSGCVSALIAWDRSLQAGFEV